MKTSDYKKATEKLNEFSDKFLLFRTNTITKPDALRVIRLTWLSEMNHYRTINKQGK